MSDLLRKSALKYATMGLPVFPLKPREKEPLTEHGFKDATTDVEQIKAWWKRWPAANIGIPTGRNTFDVLDVDPRHGGDVTLENLVLKHGPMPPTRQQISGGGGRHFCFTPNGHGRCGALAPGLDLKTDGGYIVAAPSIHPETGKAYEWDGLDPLEKQPILPAPAWLFELCHQKKRKVDKEIPEVVPDGAKHDTIVSLAGTIRDRGLPKEAAFAACRALKFESPVSDADIWKRVKDVYRRYKPRTAQEAPPPPHSGAAAPGDLDWLNAQPIFLNEDIRFTDIQKRAGRVELDTHQGRTVFMTVAHLLTFKTALIVIGDALGKVLTPPAKGDVGKIWLPIVRRILRLAELKRQDSGDPTREDFVCALEHAFQSAGWPRPAASKELREVLTDIRQYHRDPRALVAPPCVFVFEEYVWVHRRTLQLWLSTPAGENRWWQTTALRQGLQAADFERNRNLRVQIEGERTPKIYLWRGPLSVLIAVEETEAADDAGPE